MGGPNPFMAYRIPVTTCYEYGSKTLAELSYTIY
jgi:hypothetical protein